MTARQYTNTATPVPLSAAVDGAATTLTVASTTGYPNAPFLIALERGTANEEVCLCTAVTATTFTVTRAYDGTTGKAHAIGAMVEHTVAAIDYREAGSPPRMTTAERDALAGANLWDGRLIYNTNSGVVEVYSATAGTWGTYLPRVNGTLTGYRETVVTTDTTGTVTLDLGAANVFRLAPTGAVTIAVAGGVAGVAQAFTLVVTNSTYAITWPAGTRFPGGTAPALSGETWISGVRDSTGALTIGAAWSAVA